MRISCWSSDVCPSDLGQVIAHPLLQIPPPPILGLRPQDELVPFVGLRLRNIVARGQLGQHVDAIVRLQLDTRRRVTVRPDEPQRDVHAIRSEEHTSELQSLMRISYAVFCLTKKNK